MTKKIKRTEKHTKNVPFPALYTESRGRTWGSGLLWVANHKQYHGEAITHKTKTEKKKEQKNDEEKLQRETTSLSTHPNQYSTEKLLHT